MPQLLPVFLTATTFFRVAAVKVTAMRPSKLTNTLMLLALLASLAPGQQPSKAPAIFILLKPALNQPGPAREAFLLRILTLGAGNVHFVDAAGATAVRCTAPSIANPAIAADPDVAAVLPIDEPTPSDPIPAPNAVTAPQIGATPPPYTPQPQTFPAGIGMGAGLGMPGAGGMNMGMAMLTDIAGSVIVKLLTPAPGCKISLSSHPPPFPARGGSGAFEVKASGNCAWQAVSTAGWLQIPAGVQGPGKAAVNFTVLPHAAGKRQAAVVLQAVSGTGPLRGKTVLMLNQE